MVAVEVGVAVGVEVNHTPVGVKLGVGVRVMVGVLVMVGVKVGVGVNVAVGGVHAIVTDTLSKAAEEVAVRL